MGAVAYVPELSWNLLSTFNAVEQWRKLLVCFRTKKGRFGISGGGVASFRLLPPQRIIFSNRHEADLGSGGGSRSDYSGGGVNENRCRGGAGGDNKNAQHDGSTRHTYTSERRHNALND